MNPIKNIDDLSYVKQSFGTRYEALFSQIGPLVGIEKLGCRLTVVPPGKTAWPFHNHLVNEELVFVLAGHGVLRFGDQRYPLRAGDVVGLPPGAADRAHQILNESDEQLRYLAISTMEAPDIGIYPDSGKFSVFAGTAPGGDKQKRTFSYIGRIDEARDYWDGE